MEQKEERLISMLKDGVRTYDIAKELEISESAVIRKKRCLIDMGIIENRIEKDTMTDCHAYRKTDRDVRSP